MKQTLIALLAVSTLTVSGVASAQLDLPAPSPAAKFTQRVGLTDITVEYSSPAVKDRPVWGALVPYGQLWRTGANASTKITFSEPVKFGGKEVPAGTYSIATIPDKDSWVFILNKSLDLQGGAAYKQDQDVARATVKPTAIPHRERLAFAVTDFTDDRANLDLEWEKLRVSVPIEVNTAAQAKRNVDKAIAGTWQVYNQAARYNVTSKGDLDQAQAWIEKSLALQDHWWNNWTKAQILAAKGKYKDALASARKANDLGQKQKEGFFFAEDVKKALEEWKTKK
jgi:hypothetical protein